MQIHWMTPYILRSTVRLFLLFGATVAAAAVGLLVQHIRQQRRLGSPQHGPVLLQSRGPVVPGPVSISGLKLRLRLDYGRGSSRHPRLVTLYAASGHRRADGGVTLELLHAVCHTQHKPRTFRVDRVVAATDAHGMAIHDLSAWVLAAVDVH